MDVAGQRAAAAAVAAAARQPFFTDCKQTERNGSQMWARWAAASARSHLSEEQTFDHGRTVKGPRVCYFKGSCHKLQQLADSLLVPHVKMSVFCIGFCRFDLFFIPFLLDIPLHMLAF